jgi:hypothetical protein
MEPLETDPDTTVRDRDIPNLRDIVGLYIDPPAHVMDLALLIDREHHDRSHFGPRGIETSTLWPDVPLARTGFGLDEDGTIDFHLAAFHDPLGPFQSETCLSILGGDFARY